MLDLIKKQRGAIMGIAIFVVLVYHSALVLPVGLDLIKLFGYGAVDVFLFLSGFGLYQSLNYNPNCIGFYKRRIKRIFPSFIPVLLVWLALNLPYDNLLQWPKIIIGNITGFSFWTGEEISFNWYIMALFSFYLLTPIFSDILKTYEKKGALILISGIVLFNVSCLGMHQMIAVSRFIIFAVGLIFGKLAVDKKEISVRFEIVTYLLGVLSCVAAWIFVNDFGEYVWDYALYWYPFVFITPAAIFFASRLLTWIEKIFIGKQLCKLMAIMGTASFEIYLIHIFTFEELKKIEFSFNTAIVNLIWLSFIVLAVILGILYSKLINKLMKKKKND